MTARPIRASCPQCGDVHLDARDLTVRLCVDTGEGTYHYRCPDCRQPVAKEASRHIVRLLVEHGCPTVSWWLPEELSEQHDGAPITNDDVRAFAAKLYGDDFHAEAAS